MVKPAVLSCFGDVALAIGPNFSRYYDYATKILNMAIATAKTDEKKNKA
ncbi:unnamed protein product [Gongylonema pulchrum]|uniref:Importin subunit beta-1/Transportin-1-like TPR repeats domain-containing protein n=1 Tax=Gongylonema pulchrum TaxID=637853 RepID=A0A3P6T8G1_9BILA|nr:unnamed protein product [Gongylonema pulchrum]